MATDSGTPNTSPTSGFEPVGGPTPIGSTPPPAAVTPAPAPDPLASLTGDQRNAYTAVYQELAQFGLQVLAPDLLSYARQGFGSDTIQLELENTKAWKDRFAGNEERIKNGFGVLSPGDYIATESQLIATAKAFGLPAGFADSPATVASYIGMDISPAEFQDRATQAWNFTMNGDPAAHQALQDYYGVDQSHAVAFFLDPQKAQALIDKQAASATIGAIARRNNVSGLNVTGAENLYAQGVTQGQAQSGLSRLGQVEPDLLAAAQRAGVNYNDQSAIQDFVAGNATAQRQRFNVAQNEESMFQPSGGVVSGRPAQGSF